MIHTYVTRKGYRAVAVQVKAGNETKYTEVTTVYKIFKSVGSIDVMSSKGQTIAVDGDWLVRYEDGTVYVFKDEVFAQAFTLV